MKKIGIKLANGDFYPVLQDNVPSEKTLTLTTAHNNQTTINVDLYRSEADNMEEAEYVDSLKITNLVAHPNGEPNLSFSISLDEENQLSAKIVDDETGNQSKTTIALVSRTIEERLNTDEYDIKELEKKSSPTKKMGLLAAASALLATPQEEISQTNDDVTIEQTLTNEDFAPETENIEMPEPDVIEHPEPTDEETFIEESEEITIEEEMFPAQDEVTTDEETFPAQDEANIEEEITPPTAEPLFTPDEDISNIDIDFTVPVSPTAASSLDSFDAELETNIDLDLESDLDNTEINLSDDVSFDNAEENFSDDVSFDNVEENFSDDANFNETEPNFDTNTSFDNTDLNEQNFDEFSTDFGDSIDFDNNSDFGDIDNIETDLDFPDDFENDINDIDFGDETMSKNDNNSTKGGISFTGLYDKETELGKSSTSENEVCKKTKTPVIICVICAIICLLATAFLLFVLPSKYNLLGKTGDVENENSSLVELSSQSQEPTTEQIPPVVEEPEEEIIVIEKAEEVIPEQPPVPEEKIKDISYKIKWGDTLWDISDTYYKNPWRYKYIARFNGIKDPDCIISGTYITIPAE